VVCGACAPDDSATEPYTVRDSAGVEVVQTQAPPEPLPWRVSAEPSVRIGADPASADGALYRVVGVASVPGGDIVIANAGSSELLFYDRTGSRGRVAGGEGQGPSEFMGMAGMVVGPGDSIHVFDGASQRFSVFTSEGDFVRDQRVPTDSTLLSRLVALTADGFVMLPRSRNDAGTASEIRRWRDSTRFMLLRGDEVEPLPAYRWTEMWETPDSYGWVMFGGSDITAFEAEGARAADGYDGSLVFLSLDGSVRRIARWPAEPQDFDLDAMIQAARDMGASEDQLRDAEAQVRDEPYQFPETVQAYDEQVVDAEGVSWLRRQRFPWHDPLNTGDRWDLVSAEGRLLGYVDLSPGFVPHEIGESYLLGVSTDPLGVEVVHLYELERVAEAAGN